MGLRTQNPLVGGRWIWPPNPRTHALSQGSPHGSAKDSHIRDMQLKLNLTATEYECLVRRANAVGMRPNHYGRALMLDKNAVHRQPERTPSNLEKLNYMALCRLGNNLNQMMRRMHETGEPAPADLEPLLADIREIINRAVKKWL